MRSLCPWESILARAFTSIQGEEKEFVSRRRSPEDPPAPRMIRRPAPGFSSFRKTGAGLPTRAAPQSSPRRRSPPELLSLCDLGISGEFGGPRRALSFQRRGSSAVKLSETAPRARMCGARATVVERGHVRGSGKNTSFET